MRPLARRHDLRPRAEERPHAVGGRGDLRAAGLDVAGFGLAAPPVQRLEHRRGAGDAHRATDPRSRDGHACQHAHPHRHSASAFFGTHVVHAVNLLISRCKGYVE